MDKHNQKYGVWHMLALHNYYHIIYILHRSNLVSGNTNKDVEAVNSIRRRDSSCVVLNKAASSIVVRADTVGSNIVFQEIRLM